MAADIIHPSDKAGDAQFIERYAERQKREPKQEPEGKRSSRRKGDDPDTIRRFRQLYMRGATNKRITLDLGLSDRVIRRMRRKLDLPKRHANIGDDNARTSEGWSHFSFDIPNDLYKRMDAHASTRYRSKAHYIRALIERDLNN